MFILAPQGRLDDFWRLLYQFLYLFRKIYIIRTAFPFWTTKWSRGKIFPLPQSRENFSPSKISGENFSQIWGKKTLKKVSFQKMQLKIRLEHSDKTSFFELKLSSNAFRKCSVDFTNMFACHFENVFLTLVTLKMVFWRFSLWKWYPQIKMKLYDE